MKKFCTSKSMKMGLLSLFLLYAAPLAADCNVKITFEIDHWNSLPDEATTRQSIESGQSKSIDIGTVTKVENTGNQSFTVNYGGFFGIFSESKVLSAGRILTFRDRGAVNSIECSSSIGARAPSERSSE